MITVACETKGTAAAEPWIRAANPQHPSLIDERHLVAELYNTRNVPAAFWIDERGRIVRANDAVSALRRNRETGESTINERYLNAVRDWVEKGPKSIYLQDPQALQDRKGILPSNEVQAMASFRLGVYLHQQGHPQDAIPHFKQAQQLSPKNWNYKRQAWNLGDAERDYGTTYQLSAQIPANMPASLPVDLPDPA